METAGLVFILVSALACCLPSATNSLEYSDLEMLGTFCPDRVSCASIGSANFTQRNCECDRNCVIYKDCCVDASVRATARSRRNTVFACMPFGDVPHMGAYVVQTCSRNYNGPAEMQRKCQNQNNVSDPLMASPVTDTISETSYRNRYCAECNNVDLATLQSWMIQMDCDFPENMNVDSTFLWQNMRYRPNLNKWGIDINGRFYTCDLNFEIPPYLQTKVRLCRSDVVSTCPRNWPRPMVKEHCESYTAVMYVNGEDIVYRNPHCAICNGRFASQMSCEPRGVVGRKKKPFSFALLLDVNTSDGDIVGVANTRICGPNQKYDPYFKKCRNLVCALPGYQMVNGKCKKPT